jgi:multicomponent Na+:H+ antiporter subunit F
MALWLLALAVLSLIRLGRGPSEADRMASLQILGSLGVAIAALLGTGSRSPAAGTVALVFALLAGVATIAYARRYRPPESGRHGD